MQDVLGMIPLTILFTWLDEWGNGSVLVALLFHASLNTSLIRLPVFPAIVIVNLLFWLVAIPIVVSRGRAWLFSFSFLKCMRPVSIASPGSPRANLSRNYRIP